MTSSIVEADDETYRDLTADGLTLLCFWAEQSEQCKALEPAFEDIAAEYEGVLVVRLDVDEHGDVADEFGVQSVPTTVLFEDGEPVETYEGGLPFPDVDREILRRRP